MEKYFCREVLSEDYFDDDNEGKTLGLHLYETKEQALDDDDHITAYWFETAEEREVMKKKLQKMYGIELEEVFG